eukprot:CAMPEP_0172306378 /NCGR_PEP_ID=MMETSP1058-20130122/7456_1 /TAXON_ID=83371 /ORGANISM="Detonula confervacea, Strain CCMP 353" /LENGTH=1113 /DNA_ID=CAMNT_0013018233 /DNA_START=201 /DNA_END=3542 /DNA_ORIENTATION=+
MPGLQSMVRAWTKINHENPPEFYQQGHGGVPSEEDGSATSSSVAPNHGHGSGDVSGGVIDPRSTTYGVTPQPSFPSSSSLSSYSFAKNNNGNVLHSTGGGGGGATAYTNSLTATPPNSNIRRVNSNGVISTPAAHNLSRGGPSHLQPQRYPYHHGHQPAQQQQLSSQHLSSHLSLHNHQKQQTHQPPPSLLSSTSTMAPRIHHRPSSRRSHHNNHGGSQLRGQLDSYSSSSSAGANNVNSSSHNNFDSFIPPPQAGADAILGRRKSTATGPLLDRNDSSLSSHLGEPPSSLSSNIPPYSLTSTSAASKAALNRSPSSSLWHSTHSQSQSSSSGAASGALSITASLDKMNASFPVNDGATIAELNATAENALQRMKNLSTLPQQPPHQQQQGVTVPITIPQRQRNRWNHRQKSIAKSHSRSDLVREMALDHRRNQSQKQHRGSISTTASGSTAIAANIVANIVNDKGMDVLDASADGGSALSQQLSPQFQQLGGSSQQHGQQSPRGQQQQQHGLHQQQQEQALISLLLQPQQSPIRRQQQHELQEMQQSQIPQLLPQQLLQRPQQRMPEFLTSPIDAPIMGGNNDWMTRRSSSAPPIGDSLNNESSLLGQSLNNNDSYAGGPPGVHWMQGWFPNQSQGDQKRRESSSGSSGTAVTGNRSLMGVSDTLNNNNSKAAISQEKRTPPSTTATMTTTTNSNNAISSQQQQQLGPSNTGNNNCNRCALLESTLLSLQADLEYFRTLELQREFVCKECDIGNGCARHGNNNNGSNNNATATLPSIDQKTAYNPKKLMHQHSSSGQSVSSAVSIGSRGSRTSRTSSARTNNFSHRRLSVGNGSTSLGTGPKRNKNKFASRTSMFLRDASKRLSDLSTRHKRQVKQTTHERAYWQNDMHLKLEKFAMMCKNLNEEASHRSNEVKETKALLDKMTSERNALVSQVDTLRARVELYQGESVEQSHLREEWDIEKSRMLDSIDSAVKDHDTTMDDLSSRLVLAVDTIENERKHQRMRRQIIFPQSRQSSQSKLDTNSVKSGDSINSAPSSPHYKPNTISNPSKVVDELERIQRTKDIAAKAQLSLQVAMVQSATREKAMQSRLDAMERELAEARRAIMADTGGGD